MKLLRLMAVLLVAGIAWWLLRAGRTDAIDMPAMVTSIQKLSELATVKYSIQKVVGIKEQKQPVGTESLLLIVQGRVVAGVDLAGLQQRDVFAAPGGVEIRLPEAKILHAYLDEKNTQVWDRRVTWWTPWVPFNPDLERQARLQAVEEMRGAALEMGILKEARTNAESAIRNLLQTLGVMQVSFGGKT